MKLYISNNICCLQAAEGLQARSFVINYLTSYDRVRKQVYSKFGLHSTYVNEPVALYDLVKDRKSGINNYIFPKGLLNFIPTDILNNMEVVDKSTNNYWLSSTDISNLTDDYVSSILQPESGFNLRTDQVMSVKKSLVNHRGILQLPTGAGKTEVMSAIIKILKITYPSIKIVVVEPTDILVTNTTKRFNKYNLDATTYNDSRKSLTHTVTVTHPKSMLNDLENGFDLSEANAVFWDEVQHSSCNTWKSLNKSLQNVEYSIGLSALAINENHIYETNISKLSSSEAMIIGSTGRVIMYVPARYYIDNNILAVPVVFQLDNKLKGLSGVNDWHKLRKLGIESESRTSITSRIVNLFVKYHRRVLVLVGTKNQAYNISESIVRENPNMIDRVAISFGSGVGEVVDHKDYSNQVSYHGNIVDDFDKSKFDVLISTNHLDEGVDISNLDVAILASGGKKDRRIIQRIGRALRKTKTGKYAYIVDFTDVGNGVLEYHARLRMKLYEDTIEIPKDLIFKSIDIESVENRFKLLEEIK